MANRERGYIIAHPQTKKRRCLNPSCDKVFLSQHNGVRFCEGCRSEIRQCGDLPGRGYYGHGGREEVHG